MSELGTITELIGQITATGHTDLTVEHARDLAANSPSGLAYLGRIPIIGISTHVDDQGRPGQWAKRHPSKHGPEMGFFFPRTLACTPDNTADSQTPTTVATGTGAFLHCNPAKWLALMGHITDSTPTSWIGRYLNAPETTLVSQAYELAKEASLPSKPARWILYGRAKLTIPNITEEGPSVATVSVKEYRTED